ncbi:MAG: hypothetical protein H7175_23755, partial [Burkholderiales bacterium]|nr:hypothetical protein [Anaerolineae bacterium]
MQARELLAQARTLYDDPQRPFARMAAQGWRTGFISGAEWMRLVMASVRGTSVPAAPASYNALGLFKYGLATLCALAYVAIMVAAGWWILLPGCALVFYAIEAQMVFLFPLAIDGQAHPLQSSRTWTRRAGGTLPVMSTVMQLALVMLFGGLVGRGFVRCWALGCLSVVLWYE